MATVNIELLFIRNDDCIDGFGMEMDEAFAQGWPANIVNSDAIEGSNAPTIFETSTEELGDGDSYDLQTFINAIFNQFSLDASHCLVGIRTTGCSARCTGFRYLEIDEITGNGAQIEVWFSDIRHTLELTDASLTYVGEDVSVNNKVPTGAGYLISATIDQRQQQQTPVCAHVTAYAYYIPDASSIEVFGCNTPTAAEQIFGIISGHPNMAHMYSDVQNAGRPCFLASETYDIPINNDRVDIGNLVSRLSEQASRVGVGPPAASSPVRANHLDGSGKAGGMDSNGNLYFISTPENAANHRGVEILFKSQ